MFIMELEITNARNVEEHFHKAVLWPNISNLCMKGGRTTYAMYVEKPSLQVVAYRFMLKLYIKDRRITNAQIVTGPFQQLQTLHSISKLCTTGSRIRNAHIVTRHSHKETTSRNISNQCTKERSSLNMHVKRVHRKVKDHICTECDRAFSSSSDLNLHIKSVHEGVKGHKCTLCGKRFSQGGNLKKHVISIHLEDKSNLSKESTIKRRLKVPEFKEVYLWLKCQDNNPIPDETNKGCHLPVLWSDQKYCLFLAEWCKSRGSRVQESWAKPVVSACNLTTRFLNNLSCRMLRLNAKQHICEAWVLGSWGSLRRRHYLPYWTTHNGLKKRIVHSTVSTDTTSPMIEGGGMQGMLMWHDKWRSGENASLIWPFAHSKGKHAHKSRFKMFLYSM